MSAAIQDNGATAVRCDEWLCERTHAISEVPHETYRARYPKAVGVWVRGGPRHCEDVALGLNLAELYDDMERCGRNLRYLGNRPRAGMPTESRSETAP